MILYKDNLHWYLILNFCPKKCKFPLTTAQKYFCLETTRKGKNIFNAFTLLEYLFLCFGNVWTFELQLILFNFYLKERWKVLQIFCTEKFPLTTALVALTVHFRGIVSRTRKGNNIFNASLFTFLFVPPILSQMLKTLEQMKRITLSWL